MAGRNGKIWIILAVMMLLVGCGAAEQPSAYLAPVEQYYEAITTGDYEAMKQAMPRQVLDALGLDGGELMNLTNRLVEINGDTVSAEVEEKGSVRLSEKQRKDLSAYLGRDYGIKNAPEDGYLVEYTVTFAADQAQTEAVVVYQLEGQWYLDLTADNTVASIRALYENNAN